MKVGDIVRIRSFGYRSKVEDPCYAWVYNVGAGKDADCVIVRGGYDVTGTMLGPGHTFHLPHSGPRLGDGADWGVVDPDDVPSDIYVDIAKRALLGF